MSLSKDRCGVLVECPCKPVMTRTFAFCPYALTVNMAHTACEAQSCWLHFSRAQTSKLITAKRP
jgi:hypothetical protein